MKNVKSAILLPWILDLCRMAAFGNGDDYGDGDYGGDYGDGDYGDDYGDDYGGDIANDGDNGLSLIRREGARRVFIGGERRKLCLLFLSSPSSIYSKTGVSISFSSKSQLS